MANISISVPAGSVAVSGNYVATSFQGPSTGAITITGLAPSLGRSISVPKGAILVAGLAAALSWGGGIPFGQITIQGLPPRVGIGVSVPRGSLNLTGQAPNTGVNVLHPVDLQVGSIAFTGNAPGVGIAVGVPAGSISIEGQIPATVQPGTTQPDTGAVTFEGLAPSVGLGIGTQLGRMEFVGLELIIPRFSSIPPGAVVFQGREPSLTIAASAGEGGCNSDWTSGDGTSAAQAIGITDADFPYTLTRDPGGVSGTANELWIRVDCNSAYRVLGAYFWTDFGIIGNDYFPDFRLWSGADPGSLVEDPLLGFGIFDLAPVEWQADPSTVYWIQIVDIGSYDPGDELTLVIDKAENSADVPAGSIFIPSDKEDTVNVFLDPVTGGRIRTFGNFPPGETGAVLDDGTMMVHDRLNQKLKIYDNQLNLLHTLDAPPHPSSGSVIPITRDNDRFYAAGLDGTDIVVQAISVDGSIEGEWTFAGSLPNSIAVTRDGTIQLLYESGISGGIKRYDLINNIALTDFLPSSTWPGTYSFVTHGALFVLEDGGVLVGTRIDIKHGQVQRFDPGGNLTNTYPIDTLTEYPDKSNTLDHISPGLTDDTFVAWVQTTPDNSIQWEVSVFITMDIATGEEISRSPGKPIFLNGIGPYGFHAGYPLDAGAFPELFGPENSCPLLVLRAAIGSSSPEPEVVEAPLEAGLPAPLPESICENVIRRLGDPSHRIWSNDEIDSYIVRGAQEMCHQTRLIWDWVYIENLPRGFSFNHAWEEEFIDAVVTGTYSFGPGWKYGPGDGMGSGQANYTFDDERRQYVKQPRDAQTKEDEDIREGPARHTFPDEIPFLAQLGSDQQAAVANLPHRLTEMERATWDFRTIEANDHHFLHADDHRYELQFGEVFQYTWRKDGPRAFRKIRIPAALAEVYEIDGLWGITRDISDVEDDTIEIAPEVDEAWGAPRIVPGEHPIGPFSTYHMWGIPRHFYKDQKNVRVEHWRVAFISCLESELPPRYRKYIEYYVMWRALTRQGPGQDFKLAGWYKARWDTALQRIISRVQRQSKERIGRMGGVDGSPPSGAPPRPRLPWQFGKRMR